MTSGWLRVWVLSQIGVGMLTCRVLLLWAGIIKIWFSVSVLYKARFVWLVNYWSSWNAWNIYYKALAMINLSVEEVFTFTDCESSHSTHIKKCKNSCIQIIFIKYGKNMHCMKLYFKRSSVAYLYNRQVIIKKRINYNI